MRLVPPPPDPADEKAEVETAGIRTQPIPPLHLILSSVLVMNAARLQYIAANVYAGKDNPDKGK